MLLGCDEMLLHILCTVSSEGQPYPASRRRYDDVSAVTRMPHPLSSNLEGYHILRFILLKFDIETGISGINFL